MLKCTTISSFSILVEIYTVYIRNENQYKTLKINFTTDVNDRKQYRAV